MTATPKPATPQIIGQQRQLRAELPFADTQDFEDAARGLVGRLDPGVVRAGDGSVVWDNDSYAFLRGDAPETVNPSLWRQSTLVSMQGLYEVVEGIYQVRGLDLSNVSFVEGDSTRSRRTSTRGRRWLAAPATCTARHCRGGRRVRSVPVWDRRPRPDR